MKKTVLIFLLFCCCAAAFAQSTQRQKAIHMAALRIAEQIGVTGAEKEAFITTYQAYKKETAEISKIQPPRDKEGEDAAEAKILSDFDKSERLLALRRNYYARFRSLLKPSQIQKMYDMERGWATSHQN